MQYNPFKATRIKLIFKKLLQMQKTVELGENINQKERQNNEFALLKLLDEFRDQKDDLPTFSVNSRAYLSNRKYSIIPEKELVDWNSHNLLKAGLDQSKRTAFVLMASGAGSRLESLHYMDKTEWVELGLEDLNVSDFDYFSKATAPMGPVSKCATVELLLQSILAIARQGETQVPVILNYDKKSEFRLIEIMKRWKEADYLLFYLKKERFGLPILDIEGNLLFDEVGNLITGSGGPGASLRALGEQEFMPLDQELKNIALFDHIHSTYPHIDTLCFLQTDMSSSPEVLLSVLGAKKEKNVQVSLAAYNYPSCFRPSIVTKWKTKEGKKGFEIVDFTDRTPEFNRLVKKYQSINQVIPAYSGLMAFDLELGEHIVKYGLFRPEIHWNKKEKNFDGSIKVITKMVLSLTDVVIECDTLSVVMMPSEELLPGKIPEAFARCRQTLSHKDRFTLIQKGIKVYDTVKIELSPLTGLTKVGKDVHILDRSKILFTGPLNQSAKKVIFGDHVTIKDSVKVIFEGKHPVFIPDGSVICGEGTIIFGRNQISEHLYSKPLVLNSQKGQIIIVSK